MPRNPIYLNGRDAQNMGVNTPAKGAEPHKSYIQSNNSFDLGYKQAATLRYGDVHPFFVMDGLPADIIPFSSQHMLRSYTLQAPLESDVFLHKSMTMVPMKAILPNTWDRFIVNPTKGSDVPEDVYCNIRLHHFFAIMNNVDLSLPSNIVKTVMCLETLFSRGSLLANLKIDFSSIWVRCFDRTFDSWFDTVFYDFIKAIDIVVNVSNGTNASRRISLSGGDNSFKVNPHVFFEALRDGNTFTVRFAQASPELSQDIKSTLNDFVAFIDEYVPEDFDIDISRPVAYQLSCVHALTDDSIDNIYTDALFRNMMWDFYNPEFFTYNGEPIQYDAFSGHYFNKQYLSLTASEFLDFCYSYFTLLFGFRRSLKFGDYFIDARPQPYSVGEMSAEVRDGMVSAIDTTISILRQRFLNWSNRVGNKLYDYIKSLTGVTPSASNDETKYIIHEVFPVKGFEVENTGSEQRDPLSVTTLLKTADSKYLYEIELTDYCVLLGLIHFDMERMYVGSVDRASRKHNRFDFFNKFFQYSGDQDIMRSELNAALFNPLEPMAYTTRHMQYKTSVNHATGGFATGALKGWVNTADYDDPQVNSIGPFGINSEFIRNSSYDMDKFYSSLTAVSLGNYFHFILRFYNICPASRQMAVAPDIL